MHDDDLHPYYKRKAERNAEYLDRARVPFFKWGTIVLFIAWAVSYAFS